MVNNNISLTEATKPASLPPSARLPFNRCNLPAVILGSLTFQHRPTPLYIDGVRELHKKFFEQLEHIHAPDERATCFMDYMVVRFRLHKLEEAGLSEDEKPLRSDYLKVLRGWLFNSDSRDAAVIKAWVESRFGLLTRYHKGRLENDTDDLYYRFQKERSQGLYASNALESQLDLLFSYCQYELARTYDDQHALTLYRGVNTLDNYDIIERKNKNEMTAVLNNLNSFSTQKERACEFGDYIMQVSVPWQKIVFYSDLLPGYFSGESEVMVLGGVYQIQVSY